MPAGQMEKAKTRTEIDIQKNRENKAWIIQIKSMIISNIEMQLFLLPVVLYFFYEFPLYATFLNLLVIPLMTILLSLGITGSFICMLCSGMFKIPGKCMLGICGFILTIYERCCEFFLELPGARVVIGRIKIWQILSTTAASWSYVLYTTMKRNVLRKKSMRKGRNAMKHRNVKNKENVEIY